MFSDLLEDRRLIVKYNSEIYHIALSVSLIRLILLISITFARLKCYSFQKDLYQVNSALFSYRYQVKATHSYNLY